MKNNLRVWGRLALCLPLALLGACASGDKAPKPAVVVPAVQSPGKPYVTISDANAAAGVVLDATQELRVELSLSTWEVANNMDWSVADLQPGMTVLGSRFERTGRDNNPSESEGATIFRLKPQAPGHVTMNFALRRTYSVGAPTRAVSLDVTVK